jgi:hypothetical protein
MSLGRTNAKFEVDEFCEIVSKFIGCRTVKMDAELGRIEARRTDPPLRLSVLIAGKERRIIAAAQSERV